jgi:hypothetical protein
VTGISQKGKRTSLTDRHEKTSTLTGISQKGYSSQCGCFLMPIS